MEAFPYGNIRCLRNYTQVTHPRKHAQLITMCITKKVFAIILFMQSCLIAGIKVQRRLNTLLAKKHYNVTFEQHINNFVF